MFLTGWFARLKNFFGFGGDAKHAVVLGRWKRTPPANQRPTVPLPRRPGIPQGPPHAPVPQPPSQPPALIEHFLNDPSTPQLVTSVNAVPPPPQLSFVVQGFMGGGFPRGSLEYQAANVYVTVSETLNFFNNEAGANSIPHWRRTNTLKVRPRAGVDFNAFYDGDSLQFFYFSHPQIGGTVYAADSADVVSHECGHSILDSYRPELWSVAFLEVGAFHECFGDFTALMHAMSHGEMVHAALSETGGDLSKSNVVSRLAEQFGLAIATLDPAGRDPAYLRNAVNSFKYVDPSTLPESALDNQLAAETHNFSRVFTGALYDCFVGVYESNKAAGLAPFDAVVQARDVLCRYVLKAVQNVPVNAKFFEAVARTVMWADSTDNAGKYQQILQTVFANRNIATPQLRMLSAPKCTNSERIIRTTDRTVVKLSDFVLRAQGQDDNPLYDVELEVPGEQAHLYDAEGFAHDIISVTQEETLQAAQAFVRHLHSARLYGQGGGTPWEVRDGRLTRARTCCGGAGVL